MTAPSHRPIDYAHSFPWTRLFRSLRIATDPRKLALAALAITVLWAGDRMIALLPLAPAETRLAPAPWNAETPIVLVENAEHGTSLFKTPREQVRRLVERLLVPVRPLLDVLGLSIGEAPSWPDLIRVWCRLLWSLAVWSVFGGAIARLAAVEFARDERPGLLAALRFSVVRFPAIVAAPLLPIAAMLMLWGLNALGGLLGRIPLAGEWLVAIAWGAAIAVSLLLILVTIATAVGWPLMVAAVSTENSDAFDGFSRAFSFVYGRPWLSLWYVTLAVLIGIACVSIIDTLAVAVVSATERTIATGLGVERTAALQSAAPPYFAGEDGASERAAIGFPARITAIWLAVVATVAVGFASSYFWTAATIIYFLLRRADDATHFDEVWLGDADDEDDLLPLAGIASTDQPVTERSHHPTVDPPAGVSR